MPTTYDLTLRTSDARHVIAWKGCTAEQVTKILSKDWEDLPEPVARRKKAPVKPAKVKA